MQIFIGIDPGQKGAMAVIIEMGDTQCDYRVWDYDDPGALQFLQNLRQNCMIHVVLEKVSAMPKQGVSSTFKFGKNLGVWIGRLEALGIAYDWVTPQKWQKALFDSAPKIYKWKAGTAKSRIGVPSGVKDIKQITKRGTVLWKFKRKAVDTKAMSLERARRLFPGLASKLKRKKDDGRADALLMAEYCKRIYNSGVSNDPLAM